MEIDAQRERWKWPRYSLRTIFVVTTLYAVAVATASILGERDDAIGTSIGGIVLIWCLVFWQTVRLNENFFRVAHLVLLPVYILCGASMGGFLGTAAEGMTGGGHGSFWPLIVFMGVFSYFVVDAPWLGCLPYALYAAALWVGRRRHRAKHVAATILLIHYCSVILATILAMYFWPGMLVDNYSHLVKVWIYMPGWLIATFAVFVLGHIALIRAMMVDALSSRTS